MEANEIRQQLVQISDELHATADDDFAAKHRLNLETDRLRELLSAQADEADAEQLKRWAERAGRKDPESGEAIDEVAKAQIYVAGSAGHA